MALDLQLSEILKLTKPQNAAFKKLGLLTAGDLLLHLPYRYLDFSKTASIKDLKPGEDVSVKVKIKSINSRFSFRSRLSLAEALVGDDTGALKVVWFNQAYLAKTLVSGDEVFLAGKAENYKNTLQLTNPLYEKVNDFPIHTARLVPIYHLTQNLYPRTVRNAVRSVLNMTNELPEILPLDVIKNQGLLEISNAVKLAHFPNSNDDILNARRRFDFEEIFISQLVAQKHKRENVEKGSYLIKFNQELVKTFVESLPFKLTLEQKQATWDVLKDLEKNIPMNRLLEGDVGSGKTLVALIASLQAVAEGFQVGFLAPTEILARQHYETALKYFNAKKIKSFLLTNNYFEGADSKKDLTDKIKKGSPGLYIGTHALLQEKIKFKKLALVVIDEQHRFGVNQRARLIKINQKIPHLLSLSATPIPRTLKLALADELDISVIKTKPQGRKSIITKLISDAVRLKAYQFISQEVKNGRQAFVITPLIEEVVNDVKSAKLELENLKKIFPELKIGLLHGKMKGKDKEQVMADFLANTTQILVSTSVVEVGVDVPNASVMVIEGAERFGLSQLHQFRGRVGRSNHQSYCFLFVSNKLPSMAYSDDKIVSGPGGETILSKEKSDTLARLESFTKTNDGFELAELDLKQRGFGQLFGQEQSGFDYKYFNPDYLSLIPKARQEAKKLLVDDLKLSHYPLLAEKINDQTIHLE